MRHCCSVCSRSTPRAGTHASCRRLRPCSLGLASGQYAPRSVWAELFLVDDGSQTPSMAHYHGLYLLLEKRKVAPARVAVAKLEPPNLSGGYLFAYENDNVEGGDVTFGPLRGWDHPFLMK